MIFSGEGRSADPEKVKAIKEAKPPKNHNELRSFLGLANYVSMHIKDYATLAAPLWTLANKKVRYHWSNEHQKALDEIKNNLTNEAMVYFDPKWETELAVDASPDGLGAVLAQINPENRNDKRIISYASRLCNETERRYSQIDKEALALVWGIEKFHLYLYGKDFVVCSDNKPVEQIFNNPNAEPLARIADGNIGYPSITSK